MSLNSIYDVFLENSSFSYAKKLDSLSPA